MSANANTGAAESIGGANSISLAELQALSAVMAPHKAGALSPVLALAPLYAIRSAKGIDAVYAMPAGDAIAGMMDVLPHLLTVEMQEAAGAAIKQIEDALDPAKVRERLMGTMGL
jgi:hypothetical protein